MSTVVWYGSTRRRLCAQLWLHIRLQRLCALGEWPKEPACCDDTVVLTQSEKPQDKDDDDNQADDVNNAVHESNPSH